MVASNVIDVGYAGLIGATGSRRSELYGQGSLTRLEGEHTGGQLPAYCPLEHTLRLESRWDDLLPLPGRHRIRPAAIGACCCSDVRLRPCREGKMLGLALAYAWPPSLHRVSCSRPTPRHAGGAGLHRGAARPSPGARARSPRGSGSGAAAKFARSPLRAVRPTLAGLFGWPLSAICWPWRLRARWRDERDAPTSSTRRAAAASACGGMSRRWTGCITPWSGGACLALLVVRPRGPTRVGAALGAAVRIAVQLTASTGSTSTSSVPAVLAVRWSRATGVAGARRCGGAAAPSAVPVGSSGAAGAGGGGPHPVARALPDERRNDLLVYRDFARRAWGALPTAMFLRVPPLAFRRSPRACWSPPRRCSVPPSHAGHCCWPLPPVAVGSLAARTGGRVPGRCGPPPRCPWSRSPVRTHFDLAPVALAAALFTARSPAAVGVGTGRAAMTKGSARAAPGASCSVRIGVGSADPAARPDAGGPVVRRSRGLPFSLRPGRSRRSNQSTPGAVERCPPLASCFRIARSARPETVHSLARTTGPPGAAGGRGERAVMLVASPCPWRANRCYPRDLVLGGVGGRSGLCRARTCSRPCTC